MSGSSGNRSDVKLRKFPFPFQAMLAIANDVDEEQIAQFRELHRFFNTRAMTRMGEGLGLDIGDSFWMYGPHDYDFMTYWKGYDWGIKNHAEEILRYISCGWIDSLHSYGDYNDQMAFTREHALQAINELEKQGVHLKVWLNHGNSNNIQNFPGAFLTHHSASHLKGDLPGTPGYHTDVTIPWGIQFVQDGTLNDQLGHDSLLRPVSLWDGQQIWGFRRLEARRESPWRKGLRMVLERWGIKLTYWNWHPERLGEQLSRENLDSLVENQHYGVVGQHLGIRRQDLDHSAVEGLLRLKEKHQAGEILVARLSRLLEYNRVHQHLDYRVFTHEHKTVIDIRAVNDPVCGYFVPALEQVRGITFTGALDPEQTKLCLAGVELNEEDLIRSAGEKVIGVRWFEPDYHDYTQ